jgi:hypothetical protein
VWRREAIGPDAVIDGPAIVEEMSATTYLPPGWTLRVGAIGDLRARRQATTTEQDRRARADGGSSGGAPISQSSASIHPPEAP